MFADLEELTRISDAWWASVHSRLDSGPPPLWIASGIDELACLSPEHGVVVGTFVHRAVCEGGVLARGVVVGGPGAVVTDRSSGLGALTAASIGRRVALVAGTVPDAVARIGFMAGEETIGAAALDPLDWALFSRERPVDADDISVVGRGPLVPRLPLLCGDPSRRDEVRLAIAAALRDRALDDVRDILLIDGFEALDGSDYVGLVGLARRLL